MANRSLITNAEVVDLIEAETGKRIAVSTWRSYVARGQGVAPEDPGRSAVLYSRKKVLEWIHNRPGAGARTDLATTKRGRSTRRPARAASPTATPAEAVPAPTPDDAPTPAVARTHTRRRTGTSRTTRAATPTPASEER